MGKCVWLPAGTLSASSCRRSFGLVRIRILGGCCLTSRFSIGLATFHLVIVAQWSQHKGHESQYYPELSGGALATNLTFEAPQLLSPPGWFRVYKDGYICACF